MPSRLQLLVLCCCLVPRAFAGSWNATAGVYTCDPSDDRVSLDGRNLYTFSNSTLSGCENITRLSLRSNIFKVEPGAFQGLINLEVLDTCLMNRSRRMTLQALVMSQNNFGWNGPISWDGVALPPDVFDPLVNLTILDLSGNPLLSNIQLPSFAKLGKLMWLSLDGAAKYSTTTPLNITSDTFAGLDSLETLYLDNCGLSTLPSFANLPSLFRLSLNNNAFTNLTSDTLLDLPNLRILYMKASTLTNPHPPSPLLLKGNQIVALPRDAFSAMPNLLRLFLSGNSISVLELGWANGLGNLFVLGEDCCTHCCLLTCCVMLRRLVQ